MSNQPPENTPGPIDQLALRYLRRALDASHPTDEPYVLNEMEAYVIHKIKWQTLGMAGLFGALGVVLLYLPQYFWPSFFDSTSLTLLDYSVEAPLITALYGILLVYLEIYALLYINLRAVRYIMAVCQFPRHHDAQYERHLKTLADAAQEKENESILRFSIDPYLGLPRWGLMFYFIINRLKAVLSNMLLKFVMKRLFGRFVIRQVTDLVSMPVYAFWNVWASHRVIHEAKIRVMAPLTIREFVENLHDEWKHDDEFRRLIPEALQYVAILKRQYNYAHLLLTESLTNRFGIQSVKPTGDFLTLLERTSPALRRPLERLVVFGVLIDGDLSWVEKQQLRKLKTHGWLSYSLEDIEAIGEEYYKGRGLWV
ncbi:hypothetical protein J2I47_15840 [Fibrella sp. HMF5335]|uniref:Uncharacterized protein n=1 Tax=Fibrella rubiginis TaxID=2817060 RepID=A0A939GKB5_9BACT|nr:hypothetical protein [Fibrella rubiginis]MBO0938027.1 hypothetical protein [Fibrella rubiginis]